MTSVKRIQAEANLAAILQELQKDKWETLEYSADIQHLKEFVSDSHNYLLLAYEDGIVAGMLTAHELAKLDSRKLEIMLYEMEVKPQFRQRGIGKLLIEELIKLAKTRGAYEVWVLTENDNLPANKLYSSLPIKYERTPQIIYKYDLS